MVSRKARDDLQWRVSNSLLILVVGMMFLGYGTAQMEGYTVTGLATMTDTGACEPPQPLPSAWSECEDDAKKRVVYTCNEETKSWDGEVETADCENAFKEVPVAYMLVGLVLVALAISSLLLYKKKYEKPAPAVSPQW